MCYDVCGGQRKTQSVVLAIYLVWDRVSVVSAAYTILATLELPRILSSPCRCARTIEVHAATSSSYVSFEGLHSG